MNLPNKLTLLRIVMIPIFIILVLLPYDLGTIELLGSTVEMHLFLAAIIFSLASVTDWLDGYLARKMNIVSNFGKFADPLADKMLVMTAFILLIQLELAPAWVIAVIVCRELAVTGLRLLLVEQGGTVLAASWPGKVKTNAQMFAIILLLIDNFPFNLTGVPVATILLYISLIFTIYSGVDYFYNARHFFKGTFSS